MTYVPLGIRTEYSFLDGMCRIESLVERARALRLNALGIADLHSAYAFVPFYAAARAAGVRPLLGLTVRLQADVAAQSTWGAGPATLKLMARDTTGLRNLLRLASRAELERAGAAPVVGFQDLERFASGILALDGGTQGPVARSLIAGSNPGAEQAALRLREIFGADGFCMEVQRHGAAEETRVEPFIVHLARRLNVPLVATLDVRYLEAADADAHAVLRCIRRGTTLPHVAEPAFAPESRVLRSDPEMRQLYRDLPEALTNTSMVAERCQVELDLGALRPLDFSPASGQAPLDALRRESERGACRRYGSRQWEDLPAAVRDRIVHELAVIGEMELASCFLIAQDVVRYAKEEGISIGPGHGAAAGSLVCYATGITGIDPLAHGLLFERFVSRGAGRLPDFEFDVAHRRRDDLVQHVLRRLGPERVAQAANLPTLSTRSVVREVAHALGMSAERIDEIARELRSENATDLWQALDRSPGLKRAYQDDVAVRRLFDVARRLEGLPRNPTLHAGGLLVAPGPITDQAALQRTRSGEVVAQVTHEGAMALGMLRLDFVASRALSIIDETVRLVAQRKGTALVLETLPLADEPTFRLLSGGDTHGVSHLDGLRVQGLLRAVQPASFAEIVATLCLCRPGARATGLVDRYPAQAGEEPAGRLPDARLGPILAPTHGLILYQEQIMEIAVALAGFSLDEAEMLRQALQRRRIGDLARHRARFLRGAVENGVALEDAESIFGALIKFANFDFDRAHGTGLALLAYAGAYLRVHHPLEYAVALLQDADGQGLRLREALADALAHGIPVLPVDVNRSGRGFTIEGDAVRIGLGTVRRLGEVGAERVLEARHAQGAFVSLADFCIRLPNLARPAVEGLVKAGAFEGLGLSRAQALAGLESTLKSVEREARSRAAGAQLEFGFAASGAAARRDAALEVAESTPQELAEMEREALDFSLRDDVLLREVALRGRCDLSASAAVGEMAESTRVRAGGTLRRVSEARTRRGELMAFLRIEDLRGEFDVVVFPRALSQLDPRIFGADAVGVTLVVVEGRVEHQRDATRIVAERLEVVPAARVELPAWLPSAVTTAAMPTSTSEQPGSPPQPNAERPAGSQELETQVRPANSEPGWLFGVEGGGDGGTRAGSGGRPRRRNAS